MTNFSAKIVNNAVGSLLAQQAVIATTANNIANVNTPGYTKRTIDLETRGGLTNSGVVDVGNGVQIGSVQRLADSFLEKLLRDAGGDKAQYGTESEFLNRIATYFNLSGDSPTIGTAYADFQNSVNDLTTNPSSTELRAVMIDRANDLVNSIKLTFNGMASLQREADNRLGKEIETVNSLTTQIADLNGKISGHEATGQTASDERDKRDTLLQQLSEKIGVNIIETNDGSDTITLANGFTLVNGVNSRPLQAVTDPSFTTGLPQPAALDGGLLSYVVYDYDSTGSSPQHIDLTQSLQNGGGTVGALLGLRGYNDPGNLTAFEANGSIVEVAKRVENITRTLLEDVNKAYRGPDEDGTTGALEPTAVDLTGANPPTYGLFDFQYGGTKDAVADGIPNDLDTLLNSRAVNNFSSILTVYPTDPTQIAAALDTDPTVGTVAFAKGDGSNIQNLANTLSGNFTFDYKVTSTTTTMDDFYNQTLGYVGNLQSGASLNESVATSNYTAAASRRDAVSAVSLDEEFTSLIKYQKAYEASGKMIKIADDLLQQIIGLI